MTLVKLLGFNEYTLRLMPFLCGVGSLLLFRHVAGRLLQGTALVLAVGLFAVASRIIVYAAEAKPYGCDLLVVLALLALTVEWLRRPDQTRWLWYLAALAGPAVGYSFPTIFMAGGVSLVILCKIVQQALSECRPPCLPFGERQSESACYFGGRHSESACYLVVSVDRL